MHRKVWASCEPWAPTMNCGPQYFSSHARHLPNSPSLEGLMNFSTHSSLHLNWSHWMLSARGRERKIQCQSERQASMLVHTSAARLKLKVSGRPCG